MPLTRLFKEFFESEKASGIILIACTVFSILLANSAWSTTYTQIWQIKIGALSVEKWINEGLMALFFLLVGLEIERELYVGELSERKNAILPISAALGGMIFPALFHFLFNYGTPTQAGIAIPMATDIAFALGVMSLAGNRVPIALKVFLTAFAIMDDLGAVIIIAIFYSGNISGLYLGLSLGICLVLFIMNRLRTMNVYAYILPAFLLWYFLAKSGVHSTITGVIVAFAIPFKNCGKTCPSATLLHALHKPVAFVVLPLFALANTCITFEPGVYQSILSPNSLGIITGLYFGKPLGIVILSFLVVKMKWARLPAETNWRQLVGAGFLGGVGFTMSIFITILAFNDSQIIAHSKIAIVFASLLAGISGYLLLSRGKKRFHSSKS